MINVEWTRAQYARFKSQHNIPLRTHFRPIAVKIKQHNWLGVCRQLSLDDIEAMLRLMRASRYKTEFKASYGAIREFATLRDEQTQEVVHVTPVMLSDIESDASLSSLSDTEWIV